MSNLLTTLHFKPDCKSEENKEFINTLSNHQFLKFNPEKEEILHYCGIMKNFLSFHYKHDILCKLGLYPSYFNNTKKSGIYTPCVILHPAAFDFIVGKNSLAVTIHQMNDETRNEIATVLGFQTKMLENTSFTIMKSNYNKKYNSLDLIHEATHITQNKTEQPTLINEIEAFINEILVFQITTKKDFNYYLKTKMNENGQIDKNIFNITKLLWELISEKNFWDVKKEDKIKWIKCFLKQNPLKTPVD